VGVGMDQLGVDQMTIVIFAFFLVYLPLPALAWIKSARK